MILGYKFITKSKMVRPETADLHGGKARIDAEEAEFLARQQEKKGGPESKMEKIYRLTFGWAF